MLGALSVGMLGCKNAPKECLYGPPPPEDLYGPPVPEEMVMPKYGPPWMLNGEEEPVERGELKEESGKRKEESGKRKVERGKRKVES